jgi:Holliday junction resolvase RusA-like endonuclease
MSTIAFTVMGDPVPQPRMRTTLAGHRYTPDRNGIKAFKQAVALMARLSAQKSKWSVSSVGHAIAIEFVFARPASHYTKRGEPSSKWRAFPPKATSGDGDNLMKGVWDAITASCAVWHDDDQVTTWSGCKRYAEPNEQPRTNITILRCEERSRA